MKKLFLFSFVFMLISILLIASSTAMANVIITQASGGINIPGSRAVDGSSPAWTTLGNIVIASNASGDLGSAGTYTLKLTAPDNWIFNTSSGSAAGTGSYITSVSASFPNNKTITVTYTMTASSSSATITISNLQVKAENYSTTTTAYIFRTTSNPGDAPINGITNDVTNFGSLSSDGIFPVELTSFSGSVSGNVVTLKWATATEVNNYGFEVERSSSSQGANWEKIGFVEGSGNSNSPKEYSYSDNNLKSGTYSYRLKQIDNDGTYEYSEIIKVNLGLPTKLELKQNFPNPFNPSTTINFTLPASDQVKLVVYNVIGEQVKVLYNGMLEVGVHSFDFSGNELPSGLYIYKLSTSSGTQVRKMMLLK